MLSKANSSHFPSQKKLKQKMAKQPQILDFGVFEAMTIKSTVFWVVTSCSSKMVQCFEGTHYLHLNS